MTPYEQVTEFHRAFGCAINQPWTVDLGNLRARLVTEECQELGGALLTGDRLKVAQELADLAYVTIGTAVSLGLGDSAPISPPTPDTNLLRVECDVLTHWLVLGYTTGMPTQIARVLGYLYQHAADHNIDLNVAIAEVHRANMSKLGADSKPVLRSDGKVLKGPSYRPPNMTVAIDNNQPPPESLAHRLSLLGSSGYIKICSSRDQRPDTASEDNHVSGVVYLAGPMTGMPEWNHPAFHAAAKQLRAAGHTVINPAEHGLHETDWVTCVRRGLRELLGATEVVVLPGWQQSKGARLEIAVAGALGMPVRDLAAVLNSSSEEVNT